MSEECTTESLTLIFISYFTGLSVLAWEGLGLKCDQSHYEMCYHLLVRHTPHISLSDNTTDSVRDKSSTATPTSYHGQIIITIFIFIIYLGRDS